MNERQKERKKEIKKCTKPRFNILNHYEQSLFETVEVKKNLSSVFKVQI